MNTHEVQTRIFKVISEQFNVPIADVSPKTLLIDDLGADSAAFVELSARLEDAFSAQFPDLRHLADKEVGELIAYISEFTAAPQAATIAKG